MSFLSAQPIPAQSQSLEDRVSSFDQFAARFAARWPEWITLALYATLVGFAIPYHEPWADEAQAWQLARSLSLHDLFHTYLRYEGSPGLWHLLLWILNRLHVSYAGMHWISGGIALLGVSVLVLCAPFPRYIKLALPFTFFLAFQYAVVARNYVLVPLLLFIIAALWKKGPIAVAILLGLLGNVALHALAISAGFAIVYIIERRRVRARGEEVCGSTTELITAGCLLLALYAFAVWTMLPPADVYVGNITAPVTTRGIHLPGGWRQGVFQVSISLLYGVTEPMVFGIPLWIAAVYALRKRRQTFYLLPAAAFALCSLVYLMFWHAGLVVPTMIAILWIAQIECPRLRWPATSEATALMAVVIYLFAVQLGWTIHAVLYDRFYNYSPDRAAAQFLRPYVESGDEIGVTYLAERGAAQGAHAIGILPYFPRQIYMNMDRPFWWWSTRNTTEANFDRALLDRPPIVLVEYFDFTALHPFAISSALTDPRANRLRESGYGLTHVFCGEQPVRFAYDIRICHVIFERNDGAVSTKKPHP